MLPLSMFFLICALICGVFGFSPEALPTWLLGRALFFVCLTLALSALAFAVRAEPEGWTMERKVRY